MLSIENLSDPSVPCKASALKSDERASGTLAFQEAADPIGLADETQHPHFSIRDYVSNSRSKDVTKNWPFPLKLLQLCLEYGVSDVLPPFEPPDLVRGQCCRRVEFEHQIACSYSEQNSTEVKSLETKDIGPILDSIEHEFCLPPDQLVVECSDQAQHLLSLSRKSKVDRRIHSGDELISVEPEPVSTITNHGRIKRISGQTSERPCTVNVNKSASEASSELEVEEPPLLPEKLEVRCEPSEKKCRSVVKLSSTSETIREEDIVSSSSTVSDPMASKVCPVCKTFTSTSNTTLNAHIDQCLSEESDTKRGVPKLSKVKPRKKRLMVDIYTTAPRCTIEDLDRRNGTNWAVDLALVAAAGEVSCESKRPKLSISGASNDGNDGAVYVDSNGTKLRIISKFTDVPPVNSKENRKLRKHVKGITAGKSSLISKKKCFKSKYSKYMKTNQHKKRLCSFKLFRGKTLVTQIGDCHSNTYDKKEESLSCILNAEDQAKSHGPGTLRQWVCSKRSGPSRKFNKKGTHRSMESTVPSTLDTSVEGNQPDPGNSSVVKSHILKLSRSAEVLASSPKTKRVDILSNSVHATHNSNTRPPKPPKLNSRLSPENTSLASGLMLKPSRSSGNFVSSPRNKREEIQLSTLQKSDNSSDINTIPSECCHPSPQTRKRSMSKKNVLLGKSFSFEESKGDEGEKRLTVKKFRKHRSISVSGKRRGKLPSDINKGLHGSTEDFGFDHSPRANETSNANQPSLSENLTISRVRESEQEREGFSTMVKQQDAKKRLHLGARADCYASDIEASDMQCEPFGCDDVANQPSMDKAVNEHGGGENLIIQHLAPAFSPRLTPRPSELEHGESFCGSEAPLEGRLNDEQVLQCDVTRNKIINKHIEQVGEEGNLCILKQSEDQRSTSIKVSSTSLIVPVDMVLGFPQENSSITTLRMTSSQDRNLAGGIEASGSLASTSSNICPCSPELSQSKDSDAKQCVKDAADQDKLSSSLLNNSVLPCVASTRGTEGMKLIRNQVKAIAAVTEPEKLSHDQPCYCFCRESLSQESPQPLRQSTVTKSIFSSKGKQIVSNLCIRPTISSSSSAFHCLKTGEISAPILESPTESILAEVSSDFASKIPPGSDFGPPSPYSHAQGQATSNPIFRLMGKDLFLKNEELAQLPKVLPSDSDYASTMKCLPLGLTSMNNGLSKISFSYQQHQIPIGCAVLSQDSPKAKQQVSGFVGVPSIKSQQKRGKKLRSPLPSSIGTTTASQHHQNPLSSVHPPYRDVIVIDDSSEVEAELSRSVPSPAVALPPAFQASSTLIPPRPFSCFPPKSPYVSREVRGIVRPSYSLSHPMANAYIPVKHDNTSEGSVPLSSYMFQSPSTAHLTPSLCYSRTFQ
ncbi:uncharacterized protein [Elaeis guineensis]|uniref:Uncharacterized protein LOC105050538 n=1 Tax=Elaeis guineensis var. tenera TaxID=51953 RepID=A0A6J0PM37_ELAGV|nr:uncharacterized protein LOC105050538 [Elaeis guineensis]XP_010928902.1 uncharacterized protein LOC105050538 [Elaeis guineensis]XP_019708121.1 uncharacterized protein LOC105050538 [Elaeis guineensis]XP_019708122.1 uncharacterized protein LOC105050538 [Elaeis guineensis]